MCGIIAVVGKEPVASLIIDGLSRLEYRGYDSAGVVLCENELIRFRESNGTDSLSRLATDVILKDCKATLGIGHTRWATHGKPSIENAHPLFDCNNEFAIVHNGIIENHFELKEELLKRGHEFTSNTDSEVIAHLAEESVEAGKNLGEILSKVVSQLHGTYAIGLVGSKFPNELAVAKNISPLIIGVADDFIAVASDIPALLGKVSEFYLVFDGQCIDIKDQEINVVSANGEITDILRTEVNWDLNAAEKGGYETFMLKEIHEQPSAVADTLRGKKGQLSTLVFDEMRLSAQELRDIEKIFLVACGSSFHAAMVAKYAIEHWTRLQVEIDIASEFRYRDPILDSRTLVVGVSQSGETIDTLQAIKEAKRWKSTVVAISNVVDSSLSREADTVLYTRAGPEVGVAATKTYVSQITALEILALALAELRGTLYPSEVDKLFDELSSVPLLIDETLKSETTYREISREISYSKDFFFLGRHVGYPTALEAALKLKEISYLHAEGYAAGELKHGPIALVDDKVVAIGIATKNRLLDKVKSNLEEVKARGALIAVVASEEFTKYCFKVPVTHELFHPIIDIIPMQFLAYELAQINGNDVDRPRNLAKTVTVE